MQGHRCRLLMPRELVQAALSTQAAREREQTFATPEPHLVALRRSTSRPTAHAWMLWCWNRHPTAAAASSSHPFLLLFTESLWPRDISCFRITSRQQPRSLLAVRPYLKDSRPPAAAF